MHFHDLIFCDMTILTVVFPTGFLPKRSFPNDRPDHRSLEARVDTVVGLARGEHLCRDAYETTVGISGTDRLNIRVIASFVDRIASGDEGRVG